MSETPGCPRCKTNINVVRIDKTYKCTHCKKEFIIEEQKRLI